MMKIIRIIILSITLALCLNTLLISQEFEINVDTNITFQKITGWEATSFIISQCNPDYNIIRDSVIKKAVNEIGINRIRLEIRSGVENSIDYYKIWKDNGCPSGTDTNYLAWRASRYATVNDNNDTTINWNGFQFTDFDEKIESIVLPMQTELLKKGEKLFINVCYVAFTGQIKQGIYIHDNPDEYSEFVLATYIHMKEKYNLTPDTWEVVLEPDNVSQWNGTKLGQAIAKSAERLLKNGFKPRFVAPSNTNMTNAIKYFDDMIKVNGVIENIEELSYHRYGGVSLQSLTTIADRARQYNINTSMLEWWFDNSTFRVLHEDLTIGNNSTFQEAALSGLFDITKISPGNYSYKINGITEFNKIYYNLFRPGDIRIMAQANNTKLKPVAFRNKSGMLSFVIIADTTGNIKIKQVLNGNYIISLYNQDFSKRFTTQTSSMNNELSFSLKNTGLVSIKQIDSITDVSEQNFSTDFSVYPNPASGIITIAGFSGNAKIFDIMGCEVWSGEVKENAKINIEAINSGIYFLKMINLQSGKISILKIVKI
ncbi:MAG: T9SS type A sorting domain-containing protein [Bacteroidota bacterium]